MSEGGARLAKARQRGRRTLLVALLASALFHGSLLFFLRSVPPQPARRVQVPVQFTLLEHASPRPAKKPEPVPRTAGKAASGPARTATPGEGRPGPALELGPSTLGPSDTPFLKNAMPVPSLGAVSEQAAEAVVKSRGSQHAPGDSAAERLGEALQRGTGALAVERGGFWNAYFTTVRKALLVALSIEHVQTPPSGKINTRLRLVIGSDGVLREFDIVIHSGNSGMDVQIEQALHQMAQLSPPPDEVLQGKTEVVSEWEFTVHPDLAVGQGHGAYGPLGFGMVFDLTTVANPAVDLTPLERNVALATYWTR